MRYSFGLWNGTKWKSGLIKSIGVLNHNLIELKRAQEILDKDRIKITAVQNQNMY